MSNKPQPQPQPGGNPPKAPEPVTFNTSGLRPVKAVFQMDIDQLKTEIRKIAEKQIDGIRDVSFDRDPVTGAVRGFIWFDANGDHFVDKSIEGTALAGGRNSCTSPQFKKFVEKFGWCPFDDDPEHGSQKVPKKGIVGNNTNPEVREKLLYVQISLNPFLFIIFDMFGAAYKTQFNKGTPKFKMSRKWRFRKGESGPYHTLVGLTVEKYVADAYALAGRPMASRSGRFS